MRKLNYRTCFILSTAALVIACVCCGALGLVLTIQQAAPAADVNALARQLEGRIREARLAHHDLSSLWSRLQTGQPASCAEPLAQAPAIFVMRPDEERDHPQLAEAAARFNHAIDRLQWALNTWEGVCATPAPAAEVIAEGQAFIDAARAALDEAEAALPVTSGG